jgi:hypothetical protein
MAPSRGSPVNRTQEDEPLLPAVSYTESSESEPDDALAETRPSLWSTLLLYKVCRGVLEHMTKASIALTTHTQHTGCVGVLCQVAVQVVDSLV